MSIEKSEGGREYNAEHVSRFLSSAFGIPVANDGSGLTTSWDVDRVRVLVNEKRGEVDIYGLNPEQRLFHPDDERSGIKVPRYFYSLFLLKVSDGWYCTLDEGGTSLNCRIPLADFEAKCI